MSTPLAVIWRHYQNHLCIHITERIVSANLSVSWVYLPSDIIHCMFFQRPQQIRTDTDVNVACNE